jgi:hypothetical protein
VSIGNSVTTIGYMAFRGSKNQLTSVTIPESVNSIQHYAFSQNQLTNLTFLGSRPEISSVAYEYNNLSSISYCSGATGWPGDAIEGITPQLDENCGDSNNHGDDHGDDEYEEEHHGEFCYGDEHEEEHEDDHHGENCYGDEHEEEHEEDHHGEYCALHSDEHGDEDGHEEEHDHDGHCYSPLDLDQNGSFEALTDALILLRYAFGLRGDNLINGAIATDANRTAASEIEAHIQSLLP